MRNTNQNKKQNRKNQNKQREAEEVGATRKSAYERGDRGTGA